MATCNTDHTARKLCNGVSFIWHSVAVYCLLFTTAVFDFRHSLSIQ